MTEGNRIDWWSKWIESKFSHSSEKMGERLNREYGVSLIVLFGSVASGYSAKGMNLSSDIDIAIYLSAGKQDGRRSDRLGSKLDDYLFDAHLLLIGEFTDLLRTDSVDVVLINESPAALKYEIFTKGILAYQGNENRGRRPVSSRDRGIL